jgi:ABC-type lipoprotein export system ATPase subunit
MAINISTETILKAESITREFRTGSVVVQALRGIDLTIQSGEMVALRGRSGAGKTTLLNILVGLDDPTSGRVEILERDLSTMNEVERAKLRRESVGMMFQNAHLFPSLTAQENVEIPLRLARCEPKERTRRSAEVLDMVGLGGRAKHRGLELSGGEQQRVALARALVHNPKFVVADEPTGNLDSMTGQMVISLLRDISHRTSIGFLVATHDMIVVNSSDRVLQISDGMLSEQ